MLFGLWQMTFTKKKKEVSSTITKHTLDTLIFQAEIIKCLFLLLWQDLNNDRLTDGESGRWREEKGAADMKFLMHCYATGQELAAEDIIGSVQRPLV